MISNDDVETKLDYGNMKLNVTYTSDKTIANKWARDHIINRPQTDSIHPHFKVSMNTLPIGYDSEWRPNYDPNDKEPSPPALIQLCVDQKHVLLFQMVGMYNRHGSTSYPDFMNPSIGDSSEMADLSRVFTSGDYLKLGTSIGTDFDLLNSFHGLNLSSLRQSSYDLEKIGRLHYQWAITHMFGHDFVSTMGKVKRVFHEVRIRTKLVDTFGFPQIELCDPLLSPEHESSVRHSIETARLYFQAIDFIDLKKMSLAEGNPQEPSFFGHLRNWKSPLYLPTLSKNLKSGLAASVKRYMKYNLDKVKRVTCSNWEKYPLSDIQIQYAALDAWVSECVFHGIVDDIMRRSSTASERNQAFKQIFPLTKFNHDAI